MSAIKIKCQTTGKQLSTGISMSKELFQNIRLIQDAVAACPHCGRTHVWEKKDAWLED